MKDYDSILKEKKKYEEEPKEREPKPFPWLRMDIFSIAIVIIISYIFYYNKILTPKNIFLTDLNDLLSQYQIVLNPLNLTTLTNEDYNLEGTIELNNKKYQYIMNKNDDKSNLSISLNNQNLTYYTLDNNTYIKLSSFKEQYIKISQNNYLNIINNLFLYFSNNLKEENFIKKFYLNGTTPIVESNLILTNENLLTNPNLTNLDNSYEVLFTFKNNAITNDIISMKITINNQTTNERAVILYEDKILTYKDDTNNLKFQLETKDHDFTLKIYQEDTLFSVLTGTNKEDSYQYMYQVIDKIYNITLITKKKENITTYEITSNIEKNGITINPNLTITLNKNKEIISELPSISTQEIKDYEDLTPEEKTNYQSNLEEIIGELRKFIKEYQ